MSETNIIPEITNPLGKHWDQPDKKNILLDDTHALMDKRTFDGLLEYSSSIPSGVYAGKMWKCKYIDGWGLRWFDDCNETSCRNNQRIILLID